MSFADFSELCSDRITEIRAKDKNAGVEMARQHLIKGIHNPFDHALSPDREQRLRRYVRMWPDARASACHRYNQLHRFNDYDWIEDEALCKFDARAQDSIDIGTNEWIAGPIMYILLDGSANLGKISNPVIWEHPRVLCSFYCRLAVLFIHAMSGCDLV